MLENRFYIVKIYILSFGKWNIIETLYCVMTGTLFEYIKQIIPSGQELKISAYFFPSVSK